MKNINVRSDDWSADGEMAYILRSKDRKLSTLQHHLSFSYIPQAEEGASSHYIIVGGKSRAGRDSNQVQPLSCV